MTRAEMRTLISQWVDDPDFGYFTEATLNTFINNALYEVQKRLIMAGENFYITCVTTPTVTDQAEYALPDDFWGVRKVKVITGGSGVTASYVILDAISMGQSNQFATTGCPQAFYLKKNNIVLVPAPNTDTYTIELEYAYQIPLMTLDNDVPDVPTHFQEYVAILAAYNCFIKDDRVPSILETKRDQYEKLMDEAADNRVMSKARTIIITSDGYYGNY